MDDPRFDDELTHPANAGLVKAIALLNDIKDVSTCMPYYTQTYPMEPHIAPGYHYSPTWQQFPDVSVADFFQLASVTAIEFCGGPKIPFRFGRKDAEQKDCTPDGRLPDANKRMPHLREVFHRMGLTDKDIVVLSGAHCLGAAHKVSP